MSTTQKWIDLRDDQSGARLKLDLINGDRFLFIIGMSKVNPKWDRAVNELEFTPSSNHKFLIKQVQPDERIRISTYRAIWPEAVYTEMPIETIGLNRTNSDTNSRTIQSNQMQIVENTAVALGMLKARSLGRDSSGNEVYENQVRCMGLRGN
jgi:hypothetical protein